MRDPGDLVAVVPYLLEFHPSDSLVVVLSRAGRVHVTGRIDLPPPSEASSVVTYVQDLMAAQRCDGVSVLIYSGEAGPARVLGERLAGGLSSSGLTEALYVGDERWWSLTCEASCCPAEGVPYDLSAHPVVAEAVWAGLTARNSRDALRDEVRGPAADQWPVLDKALADALPVLDRSRRQRCRQMASLVDASLGQTALSVPTCATLAVLALDLEVRDVAWARMTREDARAHVDLWWQVVARVTPPFAAAPLGMLGMAAWISGGGALVNCCIERLEEVAPDYTLTSILTDVVDRALAPSFWEEWSASLREVVTSATGGADRGDGGRGLAAAGG